MKGREHIHVIDGTSVSSHIDNIIDLPRLLVVSHGSSTVFPPHAHFLASSLHTPPGRANGKNTVTQSLPSQLMSGAEQNRTPIQLLAMGRCVVAPCIIMMALRVVTVFAAALTANGMKLYSGYDLDVSEQSGTEPQPNVGVTWYR